MNKKDLIKNFKDYSPEQIAEAIKSGVVTSYELLHETGGAYTPLLKKKVQQALEKMELKQDTEPIPTIKNERPDEGATVPSETYEPVALPEIPTLEIPTLIEPARIESDNPKIDEQPSANITSKPGMFRNPFSFTGRIRRTEYGITMIISFFLNMAFNFYINEITYSSSADTSGMLVLYFVLLIPYLWFFWAQGAKRCHDRGNSGWYQIIPFYGLWMLFGEGEPNENEYGTSPK